MEIQEFVAKVVKLPVYLYIKNGEGKMDVLRPIQHACGLCPTSVYLCKEWVTGGASGGSCWGDEAQSVSGEPEPFFGDFETVARIMVPFMIDEERHNLCVCVLENASLLDADYCESDYYGNFTNYGVRAISLHDAYFLLKDLNNLYDELKKPVI